MSKQDREQIPLDFIALPKGIDENTGSMHG